MITHRSFRSPVYWFSATATALLLVSAAASSSPAQSSKEKDDQAVLKANEDCNNAELHADIAAMDACETDDFTHTHANGEVEHKAEYLKGVSSGAHKFLTLDMTDLHVRTYGSAGIVEGHMHLRANNSGKIADVQNLFMTVWVKQGGKWREAAWIADRLPDPKTSSLNTAK